MVRQSHVGINVFLTKVNTTQSKTLTNHNYIVSNHTSLHNIFICYGDDMNDE